MAFTRSVVEEMADAAWAIEVKSGRSGRTSGLAAFQREYPKAKSLLVGAEGIPLREFFAAPAEEWFA